jgi:hypothetical protein
MKEILESLDKDIFTAELIAKIEAKFTELVEAKSVEKAEQFVDGYVELVKESLKEEVHAELVESYESALVKYKADLEDTLNEYTAKVVDNFINEEKETLSKIESNAKYSAIVEAFDSMVVAGGVSLVKIAEAVEESREEVVIDATEAEKLESEIAELKSKLNASVNESISFKKENAKLVQMGLLSEIKEGLTPIAQEKFLKLAELVELTEDISIYVSKLESIKESLASGSNNIYLKDEESDETLTESKKTFNASSYSKYFKK